MNRVRNEILVFWAMRLVAYSMIVIVGYIVLDIVVKGVGTINVEFLTKMPRNSGLEGGILNAIVGTFWLVLVSILAALPLGVACAIYLTEYARPTRFTAFVRLAITTLAGVPSIVFGLFGLGLFVYTLHFGQSILAGGLTLACLILPTIIVASEEALRAIPSDFRAGGMALGATKWYTIRTNVLPYALPGILTGSILGIGRAAGETAPILLTVAAAWLPFLPNSPFDKVAALPYHLYYLSSQVPDMDAAKPMQYGTALVLIVLVLGMNLTAILLRSYFSRKYRW